MRKTTTINPNLAPSVAPDVDKFAWNYSQYQKKRWTAMSELRVTWYSDTYFVRWHGITEAQLGFYSWPNQSITHVRFSVKGRKKNDDQLYFSSNWFERFNKISALIITIWRLLWILCKLTRLFNNFVHKKSKEKKELRNNEKDEKYFFFWSNSKRNPLSLCLFFVYTKIVVFFCFFFLSRDRYSSQPHITKRI